METKKPEDDVEGHKRTRAVETTTTSKATRGLAQSATTMTWRATRGPAPSTTMTSRATRGPGRTMAKKPAPDADKDKAAKVDPDDVEGHMLSDPWTGMHLAETREREIKEAYRRKALEEEARRPHRKDGR